MPSNKQLAANRQNAALSTGPVTEAGKAVVAKNAVRHGLLSETVLLKGEDSDALAALRERLMEDLCPKDELESVLIDRIVAAVWRLRRLHSVEVGIFREEMDSPFGGGTAGMAFIRDGNGANAFSKLSRYEAGIERSLYRAFHEVQRLQAARAGQPVPVAVVVDVVGARDELEG